MHDGALDDALEAQRRLGVDVFAAGDRRRVLADELAEVLAQIVDIRAHRAQHFSGRGIIEQCLKQVFDSDEFVPFLPGFDKGHMQADFQLLRNHFSP